MWFAQPLRDSFFKYWPLEVVPDKKVYQTHTRVIILNCLDDCYGHVLYKLLNAGPYLSSPPKDKPGLIVIIPRSFCWLVPEGVAEVWSVDVPLKQLTRRIAPFDAFVKTELRRFDEVWLDAVNQEDGSKTDWERFTRTKPFDLARFYDSPLRVTFVCREDRFWVRHPVEEFLWKVFVKIRKTGLVRSFFVHRQNRLVERTARLIAERLEKVQFTAVGLGKTGRLSSSIVDKRTETVTDALETAWCQLYASSHVIVGVHGSNMLIPSSLAAGFVEILPRYKIDHLAEDAVPRHPNRYLFFLGRFLDAYASPRLVALHVCSLIKNFSYWQ